MSIKDAAKFVLSISVGPEPTPERHTVFDLVVDGDRVVDRGGLPFSPEEYSRFKHGDALAQRKYGFMLADRFIETHRELLLSHPESVAIAPFAYMHVETAAGNTMRYFHERLGNFLRAHGKRCIERFHVYRYATDHSRDHNYAKMGLEDRKRILGHSLLSVDGKRLKDKTVIMIDDVFITGNSESSVHRVLRDIGAKKVIFWYIAKVDLESAGSNPGIESALNQWEIKNLRDLAKIMVPGRYNFNLRNCKFVLEHPEADVRELIGGLDDELLHELYATALANSYYTEDKYRGNIDLIARELDRRGM